MTDDQKQEDYPDVTACEPQNLIRASRCKDCDFLWLSIGEPPTECQCGSECTEEKVYLLSEREMDALKAKSVPRVCVKGNTLGKTDLRQFRRVHELDLGDQT